MNIGPLKGLTVFITGSNSGIGKEIALKVAKHGANVVITAKTTATIQTTVKEIVDAGGKALGCTVDIRNENDIKEAVAKAVEKFGGIDILINNVSVVLLGNTMKISVENYDLMQSINNRGTFIMTKECLPYLKQSKHPHILTISPPIRPELPKFFDTNCPYLVSKVGMSLLAFGWSQEFKPFGIGVNTLWPKTPICTPIFDEKPVLTELKKYCRKPTIMADAVHALLIQDPKRCTGHCFIDEDVLRDSGVNDFTQYAVDIENSDNLIILNEEFYTKLAENW